MKLYKEKNPYIPFSVLNCLFECYSKMLTQTLRHAFVRFSFLICSSPIGFHQRVLNDIWRPKLSCGCMIRLHARPLPPPLTSVSWTGHTQEDWERETICWREWGRGRAWSRIIRPKESLVLYESFNPLRVSVLYTYIFPYLFFPQCFLANYVLILSPRPLYPPPPPPTNGSPSSIASIR